MQFKFELPFKKSTKEPEMGNVSIDFDDEYEKEKDYENFNSYVKDLQLSPEDLSKKILDVGSGSTQFAKWAKDNKISSNIFSLDSVWFPEEKTKSIKAKVEAIPFKEEQFELVISNCSIPNIFLGGDYETIKEKVRISLLEMMRVTKPGGEIRLGRVLRGDTYQSQKDLVTALDKALEELQQTFGVTIEQIRFPDGDTYTYESPEHMRDGIPKEVLAKAYLIKIKKI